MSTPLLELLLIVLLGAVALNLFLTLRIGAIVREAPEPQDLPFTAPIDAPVPAFSGHRLVDGTRVSAAALSEVSVVLAFLSSGCGDCRKKLPELLRILPATRRLGIELFYVAMEGEKAVRGFVGGTPLFDHALIMEKASRKALNPRNASPFYVFVDDRNLVRASGFIGDENWLTFLGQMAEAASGDAVAVSHEA